MSKMERKTLGEVFRDLTEITVGNIMSFLKRLFLVVVFLACIFAIGYAFFYLPSWLSTTDTLLEIVALAILTVTTVAMGGCAYLCWVEYYDSKVSHWYKRKIKELDGH